ncbi:hypothetical protein D3093_28185 (plasmid) [Azospirillum argentinense]|uniref:Uncharacterized protein n=1 Tax=Azospirillum argentinense TaxID=2970906 RepID=A0A4D8PKW2_9PROT|nr:hypothetical protein [Azospirillum argentinense]QCN99143.1 hypothetical protein D3093_28185 [Azospirillum argentinense]
MTLKEFKRFADLYGGDIDRWPATDGVDALILLEESAEARAILADAAALDALLDHAAPAVTEDGVQRVLNGIAARLDAPVETAPAPWTLAAAPMRFWPTAGFLAVMGMAGFLATVQGVLPAQNALANGYAEVVVNSSYLGTIR